MSKTKKWIAGRGTAGIEGSVSASVRKAADISEMGKVEVADSASAVGRIIEAVGVLFSRESAVESLTMADIAAQAKVSLPLVRVFFRADSGGGDLLAAAGFEVDNVSSTQVTLRAIFGASDRLAKSILDTAASEIREVMDEAAVASTIEPVPAKRGRRSRTVKAKAADASTEAVAAAPAAPVIEDYFYFDPTQKIKLEVALKGRLNVWAVGPTGTGKSETFERLFEEHGVDYLKVSANGEASTDDLLGFQQLVPNKDETASITRAFYGALRLAMERGAVLIVEEIDTYPPECSMALQRALERRSGKPRRFYDTLTQEEVLAADGFCVWATANTTGGGDDTGLYVGTQVQNAAFRDRFVFEEFDYPTESIEADILVRRTGVEKGLARRMVRFADSARKQVAAGDLLTPISTRSLLGFAELFVLYQAAGMAEGDALRESLRSAILYKGGNPTDREALGELGQRIFGF